jgi:hypothetical protein
MSDEPLRLQFGGSAVLILCDDRTIRRSLHGHFRHCLGDTVPPAVTYRVTAGDSQTAHVLRDGEPLYRDLRLHDLIACLMHDLTVTFITRCRQHLVFHAAGLACGEHGLILCGKSGSGKSTLAAWLTASGFDFLTDELVAVALDRDVMSGLARPIGLKVGSAFVWQHWLDETARQSLTRLPTGTALLDPERLRSGCVRASVQPRILLFPCYVADEPFAARQLSAAEAAFRLMQRLTNGENLPDRGFAAVTGLARQTIAYSLTYPDVATVTDWIERAGWF